MQNSLNKSVSISNIYNFFKIIILFFKKIHIHNSFFEIRSIFGNVLQIQEFFIYLNFNCFLSDVELSVSLRHLFKRISRKPLSYVINNKIFLSSYIEVGKKVLIPRSETEMLISSVTLLVDRFVSPKKILDLGTGSGIIIIILANYFFSCNFYSFDISYDSISLAKKNIIRNVINNNVFFLVNNWLNAISSETSKFDIIISNPPYIKKNDLKFLQYEVLNEPVISLNGGHDGLEYFKLLISKSFYYLKNNGFLIFEIGFSQDKKILQIINSFDMYLDINIIKDYNGLNRIIQLRKK